MLCWMPAWHSNHDTLPNMDATLLTETDLDLDYRGYIDIKACANG